MVSSASPVHSEGCNISTVSLVKCNDYESSNIEAAIQKTLELIGGIGSFVKPGDCVTHGLTLFPGGVKNIFGCVTGLNKAKMHLRGQNPETYSQMLVDLLGLVWPGNGCCGWYGGERAK